MDKSKLLNTAAEFEAEARDLRAAAVTAPEEEVEDLLADASDLDAAAVRLRRIVNRGRRG